MYRKRPQVLGVDLNRSESIGGLRSPTAFSLAPFSLLPEDVAQSLKKAPLTTNGAKDLGCERRGPLFRNDAI